MTNDLPKTFQMRFDLSNEHGARTARFLRDYPWLKTQKVKEILLMYVKGQLVPAPQNRSSDQASAEPLS